MHPVVDSDVFREIADQAPLMIWISGPDKGCTFFNKQWLRFRGRTLDEELGDGWLDGVHAEDRSRCRDTYFAAFDSRQPFTMEYRLRRHDGEWRWILDHGSAMYKSNGAFTGYIGSCIDVTESRRGTEALRESEERMRAILNTVSDSIITADRSGTIVSANASTERIFGHPQQRLAGLNIDVLISGNAGEGDGLRVLREAARSGAGGVLELLACRRDGSIFPIELAVAEISHLGLFTIVIRDITLRKQTEKALDRYRKDLQTMSSELMLAEVRERQQLAQDLHDGLGQALFRARIKLDQLPKTNPVVTELGAILQEVANIVNTLTFELSPPVLRLLGLRAAVLRLANDMKQRYGLSVSVHDDGQAYPLDDRVALVLFRSVRELLINVAKHAGTPAASVSLSAMDGCLRVEVEDRGRGFNAREQSGHVEAGHFGLFSIRERMEYLNGAFGVWSRPGEGTSVTMTVPLASQSVATSSAADGRTNRP
jgi:PAS domain S-box-containing protein